MRRIKISTLNIAAVSDESIKKSIKNTFNVSDNSQFGYKIKNSQGLVQIGDSFFNILEQDIFLKNLTESLFKTINDEFLNINNNNFQYYAKMNNFTPLNLVNSYINSVVQNNETIIKKYDGILDKNENIVYIPTTSNESIIENKEVIDDNFEQIDQFRQKEINVDVKELNDLINKVSDSFFEYDIKQLVNKVFYLYKKYEKIYNYYLKNYNNSADKHEKERLHELIRLCKDLLNDLIPWKKEIENDPKLNFLKKKEDFTLEKILSNLFAENIKTNDIKFQKNKMIIKDKTYSVYNTKDRLDDILKIIFDTEINNLKKNIDNDIGINLENKLDENFKKELDSFIKEKSYNTRVIYFNNIELTDDQIEEIKNNYGSLGKYYLIKD